MDKSSKYRGVSFSIRGTKRPWKVRVSINGEDHHVGSFAIEREAAKAVDIFRAERGLDPVNILKKVK